jgi:hypothetical protein
MILRGSDGGGARFAAMPETVSGYGGRGVNGPAYSSRQGHLFKDGADDSWWIIFQPSADSGHSAGPAYGDVLACSESLGDVVHVRVLAAAVLRKDADAAFRDKAPSTYDEAAAVAAGLSSRA